MSVVRLDALRSYLDDYLRIADEVADAPEALNGLQVQNSGRVERVALAVDVCAATIRMAAEARAGLLLVHHGLFWGGLKPLVGPAYQRLALLVTHDIALYAAHLPLDRHPEVGNNAVLARGLGVALRGEFGSYHGAPVGVWGELAIGRDELGRALTARLGVAPRILPFGPDRVGRVGIVTGAGGSLIAQAAAAGLDTFITGEGAHWTFFDAQELGVNVYFAGHYATETVGIRALGAHLEQRFPVPVEFLDHPTGL